MKCDRNVHVMSDITSILVLAIFFQCENMSERALQSQIFSSFSCFRVISNYFVQNLIYPITIKRSLYIYALSQ